ncbi:MAG: A24 family peptidase [Planctomycetaceae bacterium]|nr:A24 family peptidase [Planctomycetaceae bacterium]
MSLSPEICYAILMLVGLCTGALLNWLADYWGWNQRFRSPWRRIPKHLMQEALRQFRADQNRQQPKGSPAGRVGGRFSSDSAGVAGRFSSDSAGVAESAFRKIWFDFLPLLGWLHFARFSPLIGRGFWIRPFCVELLCGLGLVFLYRWEVEWQKLWIVPDAGMLSETQTVLVTRFVLHAVFFFFLLLATLTDFDDFVIRALITVPGTILGLLAGALLTWGMLPSTEIVFHTNPTAETVNEQGLIPIPDYGDDGVGLYYRNENVPLHAASPNCNPPEMMGRPNFATLAIALLCWWGWCFAGMNRVWRMKFGFKRAMSLFLRRLRRSLSTWWYLLAALIGSLVIAIFWNGTQCWQGAYSALIGMAVGGGMVWYVRQVAAWTLKVEAMGFGDVTFMAMIGAFLGWQPCIFIFFIAPLAGLVIAVARLLLGLGNGIYYGPFLALATLVTVLFWPHLWLWAEPFFEARWIVPAMLLFCGVLFVILLRLLVTVKRLLGLA